MTGGVDDGRVRFLEAVDVSRETLLRLERLADLVTHWNNRINLVSRATLPEIWTRHLLDSAQIFAFAPHDVRLWLDLGSGAGFPGLVIACLAAENRPGMHVALVESDRRKAVFLNQAAEAMGVACTVHCARAETLPPQRADVVSARAMASLARLAPLVERHLAPGGTAILPKGRQAEAELSEMLASWRAEVQKVPSSTDPDASVIILKSLCRA